MRNVLAVSDSLEMLKQIEDEAFDACVTDPPYGLGQREPTPTEIESFLQEAGGLNTGGDFMGRDWSIPPVALWREVYRTLKPGAVLMAFAGTRTMDLMGAGIRVAGFKYVGVLGWVQGQGFPKSMNVGKAVDASLRGGASNDNPATGTEEGAKWAGWGTVLKPSWEPVLVFTKGASDWCMPSVPFLYCGKASTREKTVEKTVVNTHVTVKPLKLMQWLVDLAVEPGGHVLDPFLGSGTTAVACIEEGDTCFGIERDPAYAEIAKQRIEIAMGRRRGA